MSLSCYAAAEVIGGLPLGAYAVRDPRLEIMVRRLKWLQSLGNNTGLAGTLHRKLATEPGPLWVEPSPALAGALKALKWQVRCNRHVLAAAHWPRLATEPSYSGDISFTPREDPAPRDSVWTDGSVDRSRGGGAALQWYSDSSLLAVVSSPRSSTHCDLVALTLVAQFEPAPSLVLTARCAPSS